MLFVGYGWLLFRAGSATEAFRLTRALAHWTAPAWLGDFGWVVGLFSLPMVAIQWWQWRAGDLLAAWVAHDLLHLRQLVELKYAYLARTMEPYALKYAGEW